jgi:hypothetical protein
MLILDSFCPNEFYRSWLKSWAFGSPQQLLVARSCQKPKQTGSKYHALLRTPALPRKYVVIYNHKHLPTLAKFRACDKVVTFLTESPPTFSALTETSFFQWTVKQLTD